jgi:hypothetical protein
VVIIARVWLGRMGPVAATIAGYLKHDRALLTGIRALRGGERSWLVVLGFALAVIVGGFWILFALGEVLVPH